MWFDNQKATAVRACKAAGIGDEHRKLILRQFPRAFYKQDQKTGRIYAVEEPTSTSPKLNNSDFEHFMAIVERFSGGQVKTIDSRTGQPSFSLGYWQRKAADDLARMRGFVRKIETTLVLERIFEEETSLLGWIKSRVCDGQAKALDDLDFGELYALIEGLKAFAKRNKIKPWKTVETECEDELAQGKQAWTRRQPTSASSKSKATGTCDSPAAVAGRLF